MSKLKALKVIKLILITFILCVLGLIFFITWNQYTELKGNDTFNINYGEYTKYVDIYDVIKEAFTTDDEYANSKFSQYMEKDVFEHTNYKAYCRKDPEYIKPFKVDFKLKEVYQTKDENNNLVYVDMFYTLLITDANGKSVVEGRSRVTYTVKLNKNEWYIISKSERP